MKGGRRICLFGGTFDPIHKAHLQIAEEAQKRFDLQQIVFIPAANPPHKDSGGLAQYEDRFAMVQLACALYPAFLPSRLEEGKERSYTVDTLERFREKMAPDDDLYFLIGADAFDDLQTWKRWQDVVTMTKFIVATRPGETYQVAAGACVLPMDGLQLPVASTDIRARLAAGQPTPELPDSVREYIDAHGLYGSKDLATPIPK